MEFTSYTTAEGTFFKLPSNNHENSGKSVFLRLNLSLFGG